MENRLNRLHQLMKDESFEWPAVETTSDEFDLLNLDPNPPSNQDLTSPSDDYTYSNTFAQPPPSIEINWPAKDPRRKSLDEEPSNDYLLMMSAINRDPQGRVLGQLAEPSAKFSPIMAVSKYPYRYMDTYTATSAKVSEAFFAGGKFFERQWTVYYIHVPDDISFKPLLLVPVEDVELFLMEINRTLELKLGMPTKGGFVIEFPSDDSPRPRFLGISSSRASYDAMEVHVPTKAFRPDGEEVKLEKMSEKAFETFKSKMELAVGAGKKSAKGNKKKKKDMRVQRKIDWFGQLRRLQRYLGLRPVSPPISPLKQQSDLDESETAVGNAAALRDDNSLHQNLAPYPFNEDVVFISVDVESYEKAHNCITEIGISSLDTRDLIDVIPGKDYENWKGKIRARHFRTIEYLHLINSDYIIGCGDRFEKAFGESEFVTLVQAPGVVASCFRPPFSTRPDPTQEPSDANHTYTNEKRNIVLVGHDTKTDIAYLRAVGYDPANLPNMIDVLDTAELFKALRRENQPRSLGGILAQLDMTGWNLHNAGNDAAYTLQALVAIGFHSLFPQKKGESMDRQALLDLAIKEAEEKIMEDNEEWEKACGSDDNEARPFDFASVGSPTHKHTISNSSVSDNAKVNKDFNRDSRNDPEAVKEIAMAFDKTFRENATKAGIKVGDADPSKEEVNGTEAISDLPPIRPESTEVSNSPPAVTATTASVEEITDYYMSGSSNKKFDPTHAAEEEPLPCYWDGQSTETRRARIEKQMEETSLKRDADTAGLTESLQQIKTEPEEDTGVSEVKEASGLNEIELATETKVDEPAKVDEPEQPKLGEPHPFLVVENDDDLLIDLS